jgi:carbamoyltransferase
MGLASYGKVRQGWVPYFMQFYKNDPEGHTYLDWIKILQGRINADHQRMNLPPVIFDENNRFSGELAYDIAATSQKVFEDCFLEIAEPFFNEYPDLPICITGGCALNIILNTLVATKYNKEVFVGPNPNDCGIAVGMLLDEMKPKHPVDVTYSGLPLLGLDTILQHLDPPSTRISANKLDITTLAKDIHEGKIVGIARGRAEHGPRALGNRSIICNPAITDMKDVLNAKVKNREWYRPFAPVVRLEDVNKYFEWNKESRWMSFCPRVREEWKESLVAVTHVDGTARVQTVTREQNEFLYDLITEFEKLSGFGVLLNTSFNVNGKPLVTNVDDAFKVFYNTEMDGLVIEDLFVTKRK